MELTRDSNFLVMQKMDDRTLLNYCKTNKKAAELCRDENFWRNRFVNRFGKEAATYKPKDRTWKNHYLYTIIDLDFYNKLSWDFFDKIEWNMHNDNIQEIAKDYKYSKRTAFWLLDLGDIITITYPIDRYQELEPIKRTYTSSRYFTPYEVLKLVRNFYQEKVTAEELDEQKEIDNPYAEDYGYENIGDLKRIDLMGDPFFEGFRREEDGSYYLNLGS